MGTPPRLHNPPMTPRARFLRAFNSLLPTTAHSLLSPYYSRRRSRFQADWSVKTNDSPMHRPEQYTELDKKTRLLADCVERYTGKDASVLDLCCNSGRNLVELWNRGYRDLQGVDINANAIAFSKTYAPHIQADAKLLASPLETFFPKVADKRFDVAISRGTSIEFIAPDFPLVREICRVTRRFCMLLLQPAALPYPRIWRYEFERQGFTLLEYSYYVHGKTNTFCFASPEAVKELELRP